MTEETEKHQGEAEADDDVTTQQQSDEEMDHDDQEEELKDIKQTGEQVSILKLIMWLTNLKPIKIHYAN